MARECGPCAVCCVYFPYKNIRPCPSLRKPLGTANCLVQDNKPATCVAFKCGWLLGAGEEDDRPDKSGVLILPEGPGVSSKKTYKVSDMEDALKELLS